ncbi:YNFM family putative membrane transporter [Salsuginibacillus halophilus]|uniref:YNFM family putative membrane transporter n=1 Tax=Salsuginibacillus halophilus TaxID=517424 RepID=A0A2P8HLA6_9BACI|nr:MFS transporter [Salsuginibacillus halophilus]PSL47008.1 YNFM family putative membrane transporter [Salsuginibacillus halophilus]
MIERQTKAFWRAAVALACSSIFIFATVYYPQPLLPYFTEEFSISSVEAGLLISLPLIVLGLSFFMYSGLTDAFGRKNVLMASVIAGLLATVLIAFSPGFWTMLILRMVQAAALAAIPVTGMAYISEEFTPRALAVVVGIYISANSIGGMGGRFLSGVTVDALGWRGSFLLLAAVSIVLLFVIWRLLPSAQEFQAKPFRFKRLTADHLEHLKNKQLRAAYMVGGLHFFLFIGIYNYITFYLSAPPFYASAALLGLLFLTYAAGTVSSTMAGKAAQWIEKPSVMAIGMVFMAAALLLTLIPNLGVVVIALLLLSFGFFLAHSSATAFVAEHAKGKTSSASGIYLSSYYLGGGLGNFYYGGLWEWFLWPGVIAGSFIVLAVTSGYVLRLHRSVQPEDLRKGA